MQGVAIDSRIRGLPWGEAGKEEELVASNLVGNGKRIAQKGDKRRKLGQDTSEQHLKFRSKISARFEKGKKASNKKFIYEAVPSFEKRSKERKETSKKGEGMTGERSSIRRLPGQATRKASGGKRNRGPVLRQVSRTAGQPRREKIESGGKERQEGGNQDRLDDYRDIQRNGIQQLGLSQGESAMKNDVWGV